MKIIEDGREYGKGTNPCGGRYVKIIPENDTEDKLLSVLVDERTIYRRWTDHDGGIPSDGGANTYLQEVLEVLTPVTQPVSALKSKILEHRKKYCQQCTYPFPDKGNKLSFCLRHEDVGCIFAYRWRKLGANLEALDCGGGEIR